MRVREAREADLHDAVAYEIEIARAAFGEEAVLDPDVHRRRIVKALARDDEVTLVADAEGRVAGWLWMSERTNFLTGARYANLRSLAGSDGAAELLLDRALDAARGRELTEVVGKVRVSNLAMRVLYAKRGFGAEHLSMRKVLR